MDSGSPLRTEVRRLFALGAPMALTQLGAMLLGVVDVIMVGNVGVFELDAAALGNLWLFGTMIIGMGVIFGMDPIVTMAHGAGDRTRLGTALQQGLVLAVLCSVPIGLSWLATEPVLVAFGQDPRLSAAAHDYVVVQLPSLAPFLMFQALRQYLQGRGIVAPGLWVMVGANLFNIVANWALIFGHLGFPELGLQGAAIATAVTRGFLAVAMATTMVAAGLCRNAWVPWSAQAFDPQGLRELLRYGLPIGTQFGLEVWAFQAATLMAGFLGADELAAHVVVLNMASLSFMLPLGLSLGATTRVGNLIGADQRHDAQRAANVALWLGAAVMTGSAVLFVAGRHVLATLYTDDLTVVAIAASVLPIAAAFQLFDGTQVVGAGVLRGMGTTRPAAIFNAVGFYALALPAGWWLGFQRGWGLEGIWWGLCLGLAAVSVLLVWWVRRRGPAAGSARPSDSRS